VLSIRGWAAQRHGAYIGLTAQCYTVAGMASPRELVEQRRDAIPGRAKVAACVLRCQGIKCPYTGAGARATCVQVPSSEADPAQGGVYPSSEADLARGGARPSSEAGLTRGAFCCAALAGRGGHQDRGRVVHVL
jgi:hypothetical protein